MIKYILLLTLLLTAANLHASMECKGIFFDTSLKSSIAVAEKSVIGEDYRFKNFLNSLKLMLKHNIKIDENYEFRFYITSSNKERFLSNLESHLKGIKIDSPRDNGVYLYVPFSKLSEVLNVISRKDFEDLIEYIGAHPTKQDDIANHISVNPRMNRDISIPLKAIEEFINSGGGYQVSALMPINQTTKSEFKVYNHRERKLVVPEQIILNHNFGSKYDAMIQIAVGKVLSDLFRLNLGAEVGNKNRYLIEPEFKFEKISDLEIRVTEIKRDNISEIPYSIKIELIARGSLEIGSYKLSTQSLTSEWTLDVGSGFYPHGGITSIEFRK